jgi:hypothetical protein
MKYKIIFLMLFSLIFFIGENKTYSCPDGWQELSFERTYSYSYAGGEFQCDFRITYCCGWDAVNQERVIMFKWVSPVNSSICFLLLPNWDDFLLWLHRVTKEHAKDSCFALPSCDDTVNVVYKYKIVTSPCVYYENWQPYWGDDYVMRIVFCNDSSVYKCVYKMCYDFHFSPPQLRIVFLNMVPVNQRCAVEEPQVPPPGKTWEQHWITNCFERFHPICPEY